MVDWSARACVIAAWIDARGSVTQQDSFVGEEDLMNEEHPARSTNSSSLNKMNFLLHQESRMATVAPPRLRITVSVTGDGCHLFSDLEQFQLDANQTSQC